jgi:hypothetical protein
MSAELVEDTMAEIRRNWNITLQDQVYLMNHFQLTLLVQSDPAGSGNAPREQSLS